MIHKVKGALRSAVFVRDFASGEKTVEAGTHATCSNFKREGKPSAADKATHCDVSYLDGMKSRMLQAPVSALRFE